MTSTRPIWKFDKMTEREFRSIYKFGRIKSVTSHWRMTGNDTSEEWLVVSDDKGNEMRLPHGWRLVMDFEGSSTCNGLFGWNYWGEEMAKTVIAQDKFDKSNAAELATYRRLKAKFEGVL